MGVGFTVMIKLSAAPVQPFAVGVTVIKAVTGTLLRLMAVKGAISPFPFAASPIAVLLFVQLKPVPLTAPVKCMALVVAALHRD